MALELQSADSAHVDEPTPAPRRTDWSIVFHVHLILLACLLWLANVIVCVLWAPLVALFSPSTLAQGMVFTYGVLLYLSWLSRRRSPILRPIFWWLPQTVFFTLLSYDPDTKMLGAPIGGFCATMPLQLAVSAGWYLDHSSLAVSVNLLAIVGVVWSLRRPFAVPSEVMATAVPASRARRVMRASLITGPVVALVVAATLRASGVYVWVKQRPPQGLQQVTLASGRVVRVNSIAPVHFPEGGSLLLLEYFTDLAPSERSQLADEVREVWAQFRPFVEEAGFKAAAVAVTEKPTSRVSVTPHLMKLGWTQDEQGDWHEIASRAPQR